MQTGTNPKATDSEPQTPEQWGQDPLLKSGVILEGANQDGGMGLRRRVGGRVILNADLGPAA